jgi:hypothetical protein
MAEYEYKVVPAPTKGVKAPGIKAGEARFAHTVEALLNARAAEGWEYLRSDILPSDERQGLTSTQTIYRTLMVFRRMKAAEDTAADEVIAVAQGVAEAVVAPNAERRERKEPVVAQVEPARADPAPEPEVVPKSPEISNKD